MDLEYNLKLNEAKKQYYKKEIAELKKSDPKKWFYWLKRLVTKAQANEQELVVEEIEHLSKNDQAEFIADTFAKISQEYDKLKTSDINIPNFTHEEIPEISVITVKTILSELKVNKATIKNYIPTILFKKMLFFLLTQ